MASCRRFCGMNSYKGKNSSSIIRGKNDESKAKLGHSDHNLSDVADHSICKFYAQDK